VSQKKIYADYSMELRTFPSPSETLPRPWLQLTPWSSIVLKKLIVAHLVNEFLALYVTERFITVFTRAHHWSLSCARLILSTSSHLFLKDQFYVILPFTPRFAKRTLSLMFSDLNFVCISCLPCVQRARSPLILKSDED
jgi:hypothetical protein